MDNENVRALSLEKLLQEYELSQWALTWALHKLGGSMTVTAQDRLEFNKTGRIWYERNAQDFSTTVEFRELGVPHD